MAFTAGFWNAINSDRVYDAIQVSSIFDGIIDDGILKTFGGQFKVSAGTGMGVRVATGRAWFRHTWSYNDSIMVVTLPIGEVLLDRIDAVVLDVDNTPTAAGRRNMITYVKGTPGTPPSRPALINTAQRQQYPLAYVTVGRQVTTIGAGDISDQVGVGTPYARSVVTDVSNQVLSATLAQADWSGSPLAQTVSVPGANPNGYAYIAGPVEASFTEWGTRGVRLYTIGSGTMTFRATTQPTAALTATIFGGVI